MKNIKKLSLMLAITLIISACFSISAFAHDSEKTIIDNDKIFARVPYEYETSVYGDDLAYSHENGNYIEFCVDENKFAPKGITSLSAWQVEEVFKHYYLNEGDLESINDYAVKCDKVEKTTANGYNCYYLSGEYAFSEDELDTDFAYFFHAAVFATEESIFTVVFESYEKTPKFFDTDLPVVLSGIVFNGTHFENDKPILNADHDFSASPAYDEAVLAIQGDYFGDLFSEEGVTSIVIAGFVLVAIVPTAILAIIAIALIIRYTKNKKKLKKYEMAYGGMPTYNTVQQNYGGYGYNQPTNQPYQPYQPTVNPAYQNVSQTPSYVTNALNNLEAQGEQKPQQADAESESNQ